MFHSDLRSRCRAFFLIGAAAVASASAAAASGSYDLMPVPAEAVGREGRFTLNHDFQVGFGAAPDARLAAALTRTLRVIEERTGLTFARTPQADYAWAGGSKRGALMIECQSPGAELPRLGDDETYTLEITPERATLRAPNTVGVLRGLATLQQLVQGDAAGWFLPAVTINDRPRFPWRGLMIDVCRHWQPMEVIKRNLDAMALVKLNVLHLHLTEDQGFRIESKKFPRLHELGSDGHYFTQDEMREIIAYAAARGIRVVPEFDIPGHATSWVTAFPDLASAPGPYVIERKWGVFDPVLDPTNEKTYELLAGFLGEMAALFPDDYLHIGGDENNGVQWTGNASIQAFIAAHGLKDNAGLHAYFNSRVHAILAAHGKKLVGWDEILHPDLPAGSVVHSWRGPDGIAAATQRGFATILSNGYYIDLMHPAVEHYLNDPVPPGTPLSAAEQNLVLGGEATMWAEWVTPETVDSRIWPRTAAIAERLWSPQAVRDVPDMYRRMGIVSRRLEEAGLRHLSYLDPALRRLAGDGATAEDLRQLRAFVDLIEPVKGYKRGGHQPDATQATPLTGLVDCARADSAPSRELAAAVEILVKSPRDADATKRIESSLAEWQRTAEHLLGRLPALSPRLGEAQPLLSALAEATRTAQVVLAGRRDGKGPTPDQTTAVQAALARLAEPHAAVEFPASASLRKLLDPAP